jgi:hypothetical protein
MTLDVTHLRRRTAQLNDDALLAIVTTERRKYKQIALDVAAEELRRRGLSATPPVASQQRTLPRTRPVASAVSTTQTQATASEYGFVWVCEIICAAIGSIVLAAVFVAGRETQKAVLRWAATGLVLPYTVWRGARLLEQRWQGAQQTGQATN